MRSTTQYYATFVCFCLALLWACSLFAQTPADSAAPFPELRGPYLGQTPPGLRPVKFAPGIVSTDQRNERDVALPSGLDELYFVRQGKIHCTRLVGGVWTEPTIVPFAGDYLCFEPFMTADNSRLYYISQRPLAGTGEREPWQIWFVNRLPAGWSEPHRLTTGGEYYPSIASDGYMYVTSATNDLLRGRITNDQLTGLESLGDSINTTADEYNAFVAPDGSYLLLTSFGYGPDYGSGDLYVSFRNANGSWGRPRNMGFGINTSTREYSPYVSPDGKYLFFSSRCSGTEDIYWVDASIIDTLRTTDLDLAGILQHVVARSGLVAAGKEYAQMQNRFARFGAFGPDILNSAGERLLAAGHDSDAVSMIRMAMTKFPETDTETARLRLALLTHDSIAFARAAARFRSRVSAMNARDEATINQLGYDFLQRHDFASARDVLRLNTELFPRSFNTFDSYAEALLGLGDTTAAAANYRKSLELNPKNTNATDVLKRLGRE